MSIWRNWRLLTSDEVEARLVVSTVTILQLDGLGAGSKCQKLVAQANTHDGLLVGLHELAQVVHGILAMRGVARSVRNEDTIKVMRDLVDGVGGREDGNRGTTRDLGCFVRKGPI